mgnify:CR=1 FL=1
MHTFINTIVIGGGQAGLAVSEHLSNKNIKNNLADDLKTGYLKSSQPNYNKNKK